MRKHNPYSLILKSSQKPSCLFCQGAAEVSRDIQTTLGSVDNKCWLLPFIVLLNRENSPACDYHTSISCRAFCWWDGCVQLPSLNTYSEQLYYSKDN